MKIKSIESILGLLVVFTTGTFSQTIIKPNYGLKSHETLNIIKIELDPLKTVVYFSLENKIKDGYFCADKNVNIEYSDRTRSKMISSKGIPKCPDTYKFKSVGEKLNFELTFPPVKPGTQTFDIIEVCSDNCFSFYNVCVNASLNKQIDNASVLAENKEPGKALKSFINIANSAESRNSGIEGLLYLNIIDLAKETGNVTEAAEWYAKLKRSSIPNKVAYIKNLNSQGIIY